LNDLSSDFATADLKVMQHFFSYPPLLHVDSIKESVSLWLVSWSWSFYLLFS